MALKPVERMKFGALPVVLVLLIERTAVGSTVGKPQKSSVTACEQSPACKLKKEALDPILGRAKENKGNENWFDEIIPLTITADEASQLFLDSALTGSHHSRLQDALYVSQVLSVLRTGRRIIHATHQVKRLTKSLAELHKTPLHLYPDPQVAAIRAIVEAIPSKFANAIQVQFPKIRAPNLRIFLADHLVDYYVALEEYEPKLVGQLAVALGVQKQVIERAHEEWIWEVFSDDTRILPSEKVLEMIKERLNKNGPANPQYQAINWMLMEAYRLRLDDGTKDQAVTWIAAVIQRLPRPPISLLNYFIKVCPLDSCKLTSITTKTHLVELEPTALLKRAYEKVSAAQQAQDRLFFERKHATIISQLVNAKIDSKNLISLQQLAERAEEALSQEKTYDLPYRHPKAFINGFYQCSLDPQQANCSAYFCAASRVHWALTSLANDRCYHDMLGGSSKSTIAFMPTDKDLGVPPYLETSVGLARERIRDEENFITKLIMELFNKEEQDKVKKALKTRTK